MKMKNIEVISKNEGYTAVNIGELDKLTEHYLIHPKTKQKIEGKVFLKDITNATGPDISLSTLPPRTELSYFHIHKENEETYIIIKGSGDFQVDEDSFPIKEGSVIRVAPSAKRGLRNSSDDTMIYIVIQSQNNSLNQYSSDDGERVPCEIRWK